jgi:Uma2 family endonuclease
LTVPVKTGLRVSERAFWRLCCVNPELRLEREANGELIARPLKGADFGRRNASLGAQVWLWNEQAGLGVAFSPSAGFTLPNTAVRGPDVSWMTRERWEAVPPLNRQRCGRASPDFVAELRLLSDDMATLRRKMQEYIDQGVRLAWMIDPLQGTVEISRPGRPVEVLEQPATLSGEDVLPGFVLDLKGILFD